MLHFLHTEEHSVIVLITYKSGKALGNVQRHFQDSPFSVLNFATGLQFHNFRLMHEWATLPWVRVFDRHLQRRYGLGDCFCTDIEEDPRKRVAGLALMNEAM